MNRKVIFHDVDQNDEEWYFLRSGKFTASSISSLLMGKSTAGYKDAIKKCALERIIGEPTEGDFEGNYATQRGHELEPLAINEYEKSTFLDCSNGGFFEVIDLDKPEQKGWIGASPDRVIVGQKGLVEIKSPMYKNFIELLLGGENEIIKQYGKQVQAQLYVTGFEFVDLVIFHPGFKILKTRVFPNELMQKNIHDEIEIAKISVIEMINKLNEYRV